jgi:hypothetical protein
MALVLSWFIAIVVGRRCESRRYLGWTYCESAFGHTGAGDSFEN